MSYDASSTIDADTRRRNAEEDREHLEQKREREEELAKAALEKARRDELAITGEFTPSEANVTLMAGYHRFTARNDETLLNPAPGDSEVGAYRFSIDAAEIGLRLNSRLGANSRHSISAQFALGVGPGRARVNVREVFGGVETLTVESDSGTGYMGDIALGYNVFITDNVAIGTRIRGYVFYIDADIDEVDPIGGY